MMFMIMNEGRLTLEHLYALAPAFLQFFWGGLSGWGCWVTLQAGDLVYNDFHVGDSKKTIRKFPNFMSFFERDAF